jgi:hypothetical protein
MRRSGEERVLLNRRTRSGQPLCGLLPGCSVTGKCRHSLRPLDCCLGVDLVTNPADLTLVDLLPLLEQRSLSARELLQSCLGRIGRYEGRVRRSSL